MKLRAFSFLSVLVIVFAATTFQVKAAGFDYVVVRITGLDGRDVKIISNDEFKALTQRYSLERRYVSKVHREAEAKWKTGDISDRYMGRSITQRKVTKLASFRDKAKADKKLAMWNKSSSSKKEWTKNVYPTKYEDVVREAVGDKNDKNDKNNKNNKDAVSAEKKAKVLAAAQRSWIVRAKSQNVFTEIMNALIEETSPGLGYDIAIIENIPALAADENTKVVKKMGGSIGKSIGSGSSSLTGDTTSTLGKKITIE